MSDVVVGVAVSFTFLNGERHACPHQSVQLVDLHVFVHKRNVHLLHRHLTDWSNKVNHIERQVADSTKRTQSNTIPLVSPPLAKIAS